jgi:tryptophan synthase beta chain
VLHGNRTYLLQDGDGQIKGPLDLGRARLSRHRPGALLAEGFGRVEYVPIMDDARRWKPSSSDRLEGIIPALEPSHALAEVIKRAPKMGKDQIIVMNLCGRGDKDIFTVGKILGVEL